MFRNLFKRKTVEILPTYSGETMVGKLLGFVWGEYDDPNSYPCAVKIRSTLAIVEINGYIGQFPLHQVKCK